MEGVERALAGVEVYTGAERRRRERNPNLALTRLAHTRGVIFISARELDRGASSVPCRRGAFGAQTLTLPPPTVLVCVIIERDVRDSHSAKLMTRQGLPFFRHRVSAAKGKKVSLFLSRAHA